MVQAVSHATRPIGSSFRIASSTASLIWSHILSGCPSVTDSEVRLNSGELMNVVVMVVVLLFVERGKREARNEKREGRGSLSIRHIRRAVSCPVVRAQQAAPLHETRFVPALTSGLSHPASNVYVPDSHDERYFFCSSVSVSMDMPMAWSLRRAISASISFGTG